MTYLISLVLVVLSGAFSGLNLGLMSLGPHELKRKAVLGDSRAAKIYAVRKNGNLLLVTLLLGNVAVNAVLAIFLGTIAPGVIAALIATGLITVFGEIIPQAVFSRFAMALGAYTAKLVRIFIVILYPIAKPMSMVLDKVLGQEVPTIYTRKELVQILGEHRASVSSDIKAREEKIAGGALTFGERKIADVMTPRNVVSFANKRQKLTRTALKKLKASGHSRLPVYAGKPDNVVGILYLRDLVGINTAGKTAGQLCRKAVNFIRENQNLNSALNALLKTKQHLFVVINEAKEVRGVVSTEDILEEILRVEIVDEFDKHDDMRLAAANKARNKSKL